MFTVNEVEKLEAALEIGPRTVLDALHAIAESNLRTVSCNTRCDLWAAAMTAHFGPVGLHESYRGENGAPTPEALASFPTVMRAMRDATERMRYLVTVARREAR